MTKQGKPSWPSMTKQGKPSWPSMTKQGKPSWPSMTKQGKPSWPSMTKQGKPSWPSMTKQGKPSWPSMTKQGKPSWPSMTKQGKPSWPSMTKQGKPSWPSMTKQGKPSWPSMTKQGKPSWPSMTKQGKRSSPSITKQGKSSWPYMTKQGKPSWPSITKQGLSMEKASSQGEYNYFCYQHSKDYQQVQFKFLDAVESLNPNNIMELVRMYPYHLDSLLQLSDISRMSDDTSMAVELVERALYACESAFHPLFNLTQANCRLDYKSPENRCLFIALFKHIKYVGLRGCNRTALEFCKFLLSLDPDADPLGVLLMIDYYALKSEQYHFLRRLYDEWEAHKNLSQLPNHAFSAALTYFHLSRDEQANIDVADKMLKDALKMFPLVLLPLLEKCSIQPDKEVSTQSIFAAQVGEPPALTQLVTLFVTRNYPLWKEPEVAEWLERNVRELLKGVTAEEDIVSQNRDKRRMRFQRAPRNIYRHIILSDIKDVTVSLPPELANIPVMAFDPLPPKDTIISYTRQTRRVTPANRNGWMSEFFRSLLPSYTPPPPGQVAAGVDLINEDEGAVGGYLAQDTELRMGINALMDSMRDLLNNLQPAEGEEDQEMEEVD
ncbi:ribosome quality control complex subunit TCF25-like isoform X1 [Apostichopus japonicus]|uniref:ribosome quality control complex subunit TCF25-like isoform X1 n=1 Tax=Stichopus japonicus TaxID=307972 RepID=UPI003AB60214